jgi:hypothetical protein
MLISLHDRDSSWYNMNHLCKLLIVEIFGHVPFEILVQYCATEKLRNLREWNIPNYLWIGVLSA